MSLRKLFFFSNLEQSYPPILRVHDSNDIIIFSLEALHLGVTCNLTFDIRMTLKILNL
jgi:hypothetical protein